MSAAMDEACEASRGVGRGLAAAALLVLGTACAGAGAARESATGGGTARAPLTDELPPLGADARRELSAARRLLVVTAGTWETPVATLSLYQRTEGNGWQRLRGPIPANLGRSGLGWGRGLSRPPDSPRAPVKREGDGRTPAGLFRLGQVRGYAEQPPRLLELPYRMSTPQSYCVDDGASPLYNRLVDLPGGQPRTWTSAEDLRRADGLYEWLVTVDHNGLEGAGTPVPGAGSCIFLHVWRGEGQPTAGCTSVSREALELLLQSLADGTLLVQLPEAEYAAARIAWGLP